MYSFLADESGRSQFISMLNNVSEAGSKIFLNMYTPQSFDSFNITKIITKGLEWVFSNIDVVFGGASKIALHVFIMFLALFYFLRDGRELRRQIISISPLMDEQDDRVLKKLEIAVYSIFAGSLAVAIIQGILTGIGFYIFGVPSPTLWGATASISALIPGVGTSLVLGPGILYLFLIGSKTQAIGLLVWSIFAVGLIDNFLQPSLVNRGVKIHPFLILVSVLGGLSFFGIVGFVLGPIILAFLFALLEIYKSGQKPTISHNI
jgi:predicted PurR-regulated permease PerM